MKRAVFTIFAFLCAFAAYSAEPGYLSALNQKAKDLGYKVSFTQGKCQSDVQKVCDVTARSVGKKYSFMAVFPNGSDAVSHYTLAMGGKEEIFLIFAVHSVVTSVVGGMDTKVDDTSAFLADGLTKAKESSTSTFSDDLNGTIQSFVAKEGFGALIQVAKSE